MGSNKLSPHPLVIGLALRLMEGKTLAEAHGAAQAAAGQPFGDPSPDVVHKFLKAERPELMLAAGYMADVVEGPENEEWHVVFIDETADSYLFIKSEDIVLSDRFDDPTAAFGKRDVFLLKAEARIGRGDRTEPPSWRFTTGGFMRAGDFRASMSAGTRAAASDLGALCTAFTPCCCRRLSP